MNFTRALARGKLSEILGAEALPVDKLMRTIGITKRVEAHLKVIDQDELDSLIHYSAGINEAVAQAFFLPSEF